MSKEIIKRGMHVVAKEFHTSHKISKYDFCILAEDSDTHYEHYEVLNWDDEVVKIPKKWFDTTNEHWRKIRRSIEENALNKGSIIIFIEESHSELTNGSRYEIQEDYDYGDGSGKPGLMIKIKNNNGKITYYYISQFITEVKHRENVISEIIN